MDQTEILVAGGGIVGLAAAARLGMGGRGGGGRTVGARLAVAANGRDSTLRRLAGIAHRR